MSNTKTNNLSKQGIVDFATVSTVTMPSSSETMDKNKFLLSGNTFSQNFVSAQSSIISLMNIRRLHIVSDSYVGNSGQYLEALNKYGSILSMGAVSSPSRYPGAWSLFAYYGSTGTGNTIQENVLSNLRQNYYPVAPLIIDGALFVHASSMIFENNAMQELRTDLVTDFYPSNAITFRRCQGVLTLNALTIRNYKGFDIMNLIEILGIYQYILIVTKYPPERDSFGIPMVAVSYPYYVLDYSMVNALVTFARPKNPTSADFQNYFDTFTVDTLTLSNITHFYPAFSGAVVFNINDDWTDVAVSNINVTNVDLISWQAPLFHIANYGTTSFTNGIVNSINMNAYSFDPQNLSYVGNKGIVFSFGTLAYDVIKPPAVYTFKGIIFVSVYGVIGSVFYYETN